MIVSDKSVRQAAPSVTAIGRPPRQARSRARMERVLQATLALLEEKEFDDIQMAEIAARANVSVGTIYTRFPSKDGLLAYVAGIRVAGEADEKVEELLSASRAGNDSRRAFLRDYFIGVLKVFRKHRRVLAPLSLMIRSGRDPELNRMMRRSNERIHARVCSAILHGNNDITHEHPRTAANLTLVWVAAALRERGLFDEPLSALANIEDDEFADELARCVVAYLRSTAKD